MPRIVWAVGGAALALVSFSSLASADGLECDIALDQTGASNVRTGNPAVCATAAEFSFQAAHIRSSLQSRTAFRFGRAALQSDVRMSTSGALLGYSGLASLSTQRTSGDFDGHATGLILGMDRALQNGNTTIGAMLNVTRSDVTPPSSPKVERDEILFGPYFTSDLGTGLFLDGYLLYGEPEYTIGGTDSDGETWVAGLTLTKAIVGDRVTWFPFAALSVKREDPDASTEIDATIATFGTSMQFAPSEFGSGTVHPYAQLEVDFGRYEDNLGTEIDYIAPRVGLGADIAFGASGLMRIGLNGSRADDGTRMVSAHAMFSIQF